MQTVLNLILFLVLGQSVVLSAPIIVPQMKEVLDVDGDGVEEKIVGEYRCNEENADSFLDCNYYLKIYSGDELIISDLKMDHEDEIWKPSEKNFYKSFRVPYGIETSQISWDDTQDLLVWVHFPGVSFDKATTLDIKNRESLGCLNILETETLARGPEGLLEICPLFGNFENLEQREYYCRIINPILLEERRCMD